MGVILKHKSASVTLRTLPENKVWVSNLYSEEMGGHAKQLMRKLVELAEKQNITLQLDARTCGIYKDPLNTGEIILFFDKYGFVDIEDTPTKHLMERVPQR